MRDFPTFSDALTAISSFVDERTEASTTRPSLFKPFTVPLNQPPVLSDSLIPTNPPAYSIFACTPQKSIDNLKNENLSPPECIVKSYSPIISPLLAHASALPTSEFIASVENSTIVHRPSSIKLSTVKSQSNNHLPPSTHASPSEPELKIRNSHTHLILFHFLEKLYCLKAGHLVAVVAPLSDINDAHVRDPLSFHASQMLECNTVAQRQSYAAQTLRGKDVVMLDDGSIVQPLYCRQCIERSASPDSPIFYCSLSSNSMCELKECRMKMDSSHVTVEYA